MIVVSDTTPLNYLVLIGADGVLPKLFDQVYVPRSVDEFAFRRNERNSTPSAARRRLSKLGGKRLMFNRRIEPTIRIPKFW